MAVDTATAGTPLNIARTAALRVPDICVSGPTFSPKLLPETTRSGGESLRITSSPTLTASTGVPMAEVLPAGGV
ncbi:hypothetical protein D3C76_1684270 [compost metagenome]